MNVHPSCQVAHQVSALLVAACTRAAEVHGSSAAGAVLDLVKALLRCSSNGGTVTSTSDGGCCCRIANCLRAFVHIATYWICAAINVRTAVFMSVD
jgi:hypothetical protein